MTVLERDESQEEKGKGQVGLCDLRGGDFGGCEDGFGRSGGDDLGQSDGGRGHDGG